MGNKRIDTVFPPTFCDRKVAKTAVFGIPFSLELALKLSELINCRHCGRCCKEIERVFVAQEDVERIAEYINSTPEVVRDMMHIDDKEIMHTPCPFLVGKDCSIQPVKPVSCKIYPMFRFVDDVSHTEPRIAMSLRCQASIELHNLLSREKL